MEEKRIILDNLLVRCYAQKNRQTALCALLFLHGWRSEGAAWFPIIPPLIQKTSCDMYALDLPGFGASQTPPPSFSLADYAKIVKMFMEKLDIAETTVIGHSFGGRIAIKCATAYPDLFQKIILIDSAGINIEDMRLKAKKFIAKIAKPLFRLPLLSRLRLPLYRAIGSEDYLATPELREVFVRIINENLAPLLPNIRQKTLIIWGAQDIVTPLATGTMMARSIPDAQLVVLENAGHFSFLDQKERFVKILSDFINE